MTNSSLARPRNDPGRPERGDLARIPPLSASRADPAPTHWQRLRAQSRPPGGPESASSLKRAPLPHEALPRARPAKLRSSGALVAAPASGSSVSLPSILCRRISGPGIATDGSLRDPAAACPRVRITHIATGLQVAAGLQGTARLGRSGPMAFRARRP